MEMYPATSELEEKIEFFLMSKGYEKSNIYFRISFGESQLHYGYWDYIKPSDLEELSKKLIISFEVDFHSKNRYSYHYNIRDK